MYLLSYIESMICPCIIYSISLRLTLFILRVFYVYNPLCEAVIDISTVAVSPVITLKRVMSFRIMHDSGCSMCDFGDEIFSVCNQLVDMETTDTEDYSLMIHHPSSCLCFRRPPRGKHPIADRQKIFILSCRNYIYVPYIGHGFR
jgi:hypothetical protein